MSRIELVLGALLCLSALFNVGIFWYARASITRLLNIADELGDLQEMVDAFAEHLSAVYEMETFYGDQTLQNLLHHATSFNEQLETFEHIYTLTEEELDAEQTNHETT